MNQNVRWYVIFTKQQCERKVLDALHKRGYQCYCPHTPSSTHWKNQEKSFSKPLFASYVFVRCTEEQFADIKRTPGAINFLYRLDRPAVVAKEDMAAIRHALNYYQQVTVLKTGLNTSDSDILPETDTFTQVLPSLGYTLLASKENVLYGALVTAEEPNSKFQRLSFRFRLAWR